MTINLATVDTCLETVGRDELIATVRELAHLARLQNENLSAVQKRCTELNDITRIQRGQIPMQTALADVLAERFRQDAKFGAGAQDGIPDGTSDGPHERGVRDAAQEACDMATKAGTLTWRHILLEEVREAFAEVDPVKLRVELVQCAAVCCKWIQAIDTRGVK